MHRKRWIIVLAAGCTMPYVPVFAGQADSAPGANAAAAAQSSTNADSSTGPHGSTAPQNSTTPDNSKVSSESSRKHKKNSHANDLLIRGTVFNEQALSLQGVKLLVRRAGEKNTRWETYTNYRGEFAIRVPQTSDYEVVAEMKGFEKQSRAVSAKDGSTDEKLVIRMKPASGGKK